VAQLEEQGLRVQQVNKVYPVLLVQLVQRVALEQVVLREQPEPQVSRGQQGQPVLLEQRDLQGQMVQQGLQERQARRVQLVQSALEERHLY